MTDRDAAYWENRRDEQQTDAVWLNSPDIKMSVIQSDSESFESDIPLLKAELPGPEPGSDRAYGQLLVPIPAEPVGKRRESSLVWLALLVSGVLHAALLLALQTNRGASEIILSASPTSVRINLLPPPPGRADDTEPTEPTEEAVANAGAGGSSAPVEAQVDGELTTEPEVVPEALASPAPATETATVADTESPDSDVSRLVERPGPQPGAASQPLIPTVAAVRNQLQQMQAAREARAWQQDCSERQERSELLDCGPDDGPTYSLDRGETIYRALNPVREASRAQRSLSTVAANVDGLAERLTAAGIPQDLSDYLLEQTGVTISEGSDTGNRAVQHLDLMSERSAAAGWGRELLNDPWIMQRARELEQRKVVER